MCGKQPAIGSDAGMNLLLPAGITRTQDPGGRDALLLESRGSTALVSLLGAQVLSWKRPDGDVLWTASAAEYAPGKPVRGGVPLVFPWFGDHPLDKKLPAHGFARTLTWRLVSTRPGPEIAFETTDDAATRTMWPHSFRLGFRVALGPALRLELRVDNTGTSAISFENALHTYFGVGDVHTASVHGLERATCTEHAAAPEPSWDAQQPLHFRAETDRIFQGVPDRIELRAPAVRRKVMLSTRGAHSAIVWNPWPAKTARLSQMGADDWKSFACIESGNVRESRVTLAPGTSHTLTLILGCS